MHGIRVNQAIPLSMGTNSFNPAVNGPGLWRVMEQSHDRTRPRCLWHIIQEVDSDRRAMAKANLVVEEAFVDIQR